MEIENKIRLRKVAGGIGTVLSILGNTRRLEGRDNLQN